MKTGFSSSRPQGMEGRSLNSRLIGLIKNGVRELENRDGVARLVMLSPYLLSLGEDRFRKGNWGGHRKLRPMLEAYPEIFQLGNLDSTDITVRIVETTPHAHSREKEVPIDRNFDHFVYNHLSIAIAAETCREYSLGDGMEDYCVYCNYLRYTYHRACAEGKVLEYGNLSMFHTGWFHNQTDDVYMLWGFDREGRVQIYFMRRSGRDVRDMIRLFGNRVPQLVEYPILQFTPQLTIVPEFGHIIDEHADRIPEEIMEMLRLNPDIMESDRELTKEAIVRHGRNFLRRLITGAIMDARDRLIHRQDEAVLFWNKRTNKMCWLIPLRLGLTEKVNLTLILDESTLNGVHVYRAFTILPLREAFKCARLLGPVRAEWLREAWREL